MATDFTSGAPRCGAEREGDGEEASREALSVTMQHQLATTAATTIPADMAGDMPSRMPEAKTKRWPMIIEGRAYAYFKHAARIYDLRLFDAFLHRRPPYRQYMQARGADLR